MTNFPFISDYLVPIVDISLLAYFLFKLYEILEETRAVQLLRGAVILALIYATSWILQLSTLLWILGLIAPGLVIGVAIVFQPELRNIFSRIGQRDIFRAKIRQKPFRIDAVLNAAEVLSGRKRGALVVFGRKVGLKDIIDTGTQIDAQISSALILTIFGFEGPLHDGAVVIQDGRLTAASCYLPLSKQPDIRRSFGTRHRAALGLTEETDALVLIISEESGALSLAYESNIYYDLDQEEIRHRLHALLKTGGMNNQQGENV